MDWKHYAIWWHVYPLGFCGAPVHEADPHPGPPHESHPHPRRGGWRGRSDDPARNRRRPGVDPRPPHSGRTA